MQEYPIKRGFTKGFEERMVDGLEKHFGVKPSESNGHYSLSYGSFTNLEVFPGENGKKLAVESSSDITLFDKHTEEEANKIVIDTTKCYNNYLEYVTGYNSKERSKKLKAAAKK